MNPVLDTGVAFNLRPMLGTDVYITDTTWLPIFHGVSHDVHFLGGWIIHNSTQFCLMSNLALPRAVNI